MKKNKILKVLIIFALLFSFSAMNAQETKKLYDPTLDGMKQIKDAVAQAAKASKHVLIQYGGNWCSWCVKFDAFCKADTSISRIITSNYIPVSLVMIRRTKMMKQMLIWGTRQDLAFRYL